MVILSQRNAHRAATVRNIEHPELGDMVFEWRGITEHHTMFHSSFSHKAYKSGADILVDGNLTVIPDTNKEMSHYEVTSWKYANNFESLWDEAVRAFDGTSWHPEERAAQYIREYEAQLNSDLEALPEENHEDYISRYTAWVRDLFAKHSRIVSAAIVGPAKFPTSRNEKASRSYGNAVSEFNDWRGKYRRRIEKAVEAAKPQEQRNEKEWLSLRREIDMAVKDCADIDNGAKGYYRPAFTNSIFGKIERLANNGKEELVGKALDYLTTIHENMAERGLKKPLFTSRHSIWKLREVAHEAVAKAEARNSSEPAEVGFEGCIIRKDYEQDRLMLLFEGKPAPEMISRLKSNAFRWSPRNTAWQRQLTDNALYAAARVFYPEHDQSEEREVLRRRIKQA